MVGVCDCTGLGKSSSTLRHLDGFKTSRLQDFRIGHSWSLCLKKPFYCQAKQGYLELSLYVAASEDIQVRGQLIARVIFRSDIIFLGAALAL